MMSLCNRSTANLGLLRWQPLKIHFSTSSARAGVDGRLPVGCSVHLSNDRTLSPETLDKIAGAVRQSIEDDKSRNDDHALHSRKQALSMILKVYAYSPLLLRAYAAFLRRTFGNMTASPSASNIPNGLPMNLCTIAPLQVGYTRWTVLSSPHVHKTARTQFERRLHGRTIKVYNMHPDLVGKAIWYAERTRVPNMWIEVERREYLSLQQVQAMYQ